MAIVGDIKISRQELINEFTLFETTYKDTSKVVGTGGNYDAAQVRDSILNSMIRLKMEDYQLRRLGYDTLDASGEALVQARYDAYREQVEHYCYSLAAEWGERYTNFETEPFIQALLVSLGTENGWDDVKSPEDYWKRLEEETRLQVAKELMQQDMTKDIAADREQVEALYTQVLNSNQTRLAKGIDQYKLMDDYYIQQGGEPPLLAPEGYRRVRYIYCAEETKIQEAYAALEGGNPFGEVMAAYTEDPAFVAYPTYQEKGRLMLAGEVGQLDWPAELKAALFALDTPGQYTQVISLNEGYHILEYLGDEPAGQRTLMETYDVLEALVIAENREKAWENQLDLWCSEDSLVKIYPDRIKDIGTAPKATTAPVPQADSAQPAESSDSAPVS